MACFQRRYTNNDGYPLLSANERRPLTMAKISDKEERECYEKMRKRGIDVMKPGMLPKTIKPGLYRYVKTKTPTLTGKERDRLKKAAQFLTVDQRLEALAKQEDLMRRRNEQAERSKQYFKKIDDEKVMAAVSNAKEDDEELSEREKQKTLERTFIAKQEQEEEVRAVNRYILHSQCQALRNAQIKEKREIDRKLMEERIQQEKQLIEENAKHLAKEDDSAAKQKERAAQYAADIRQQMMCRETLRLMETERAEEEGRAFRAATEALQKEDEELAKKARERRAQFRLELDGLVEMQKIFKKMLQDQECEADRRIQQYMKDKRAQEEQLKKEKQVAKENLLRNQELLFDLASKMLSSKSDREELNLLRERERAERDYRRREKESAMRRQQLEEEIRQSRQKQLADLKNRQALQVAREEKEFREMIAIIKKAEEEQKKKEEERAKQREIYLCEIRKQMKHRAEMQRLLAESMQHEKVLQEEAERQRLANIRVVVAAKLSAMRDACLPESSIKDIERLMDRVVKRNPTQKRN